MIKFYIEREEETMIFDDEYYLTKSREKTSEKDKYSRLSDAISSLLHLIPSIGTTHTANDDKSYSIETFKVFFYAVGDELNLPEPEEWFSDKSKMWTFASAEEPHDSRAMRGMCVQIADMVEWLDNNGAW